MDCSKKNIFMHNLVRVANKGHDGENQQYTREHVHGKSSASPNENASSCIFSEVKFFWKGLVTG